MVKLTMMVDFMVMASIMIKEVFLLMRVATTGGELHGLAKNYYHGNLMFDGTFCNGKRHGLGKYYGPLNGSILVYEGEYCNGLRHGSGKLYHANGQLEFEGKFVDGEPDDSDGQYYTESGGPCLMASLDDDNFMFVPN